MSDRREDVMAQISRIVREVLRLPAATITVDTTARDVQGWDSLAHVEIILAVERAFKFRLRAADMARLDSIGSLVDVVIQRAAA
jgi:acyl carrier protein